MFGWLVVYLFVCLIVLILEPHFPLGRFLLYLFVCLVVNLFVCLFNRADIAAQLQLDGTPLSPGNICVCFLLICLFVCLFGCADIAAQQKLVGASLPPGKISFMFVCLFSETTFSAKMILSQFISAE